MKKKILAVAIIMAMFVVFLGGCGKKETDSTSATEASNVEVADAEAADVEATSDVDEEASTEVVFVDIHSGVYQNRVVEEMEGEINSYYYYLILNDDGTGTLDAQDSVPVTWDAHSVKTELTAYNTFFDGKKITLEDNGVAIEYKFLKDTPIDEFLENRENPEYMFYIEDMAYMLNSFVEEQADKNSFDSYDEVIANLTSGQGYAYIDVYGHDGKVLVITNELYDYAEGVKAAMFGVVYAENDGEVTYKTVLLSDGTGRPIAVKDGVLFEANQHDVSGYFFNPDGAGIMAKFSVFEEYDEAGTASYSGFVRETNSFEEDNEKWIATEEEYLACYNEYLEAKPIEFTVVE